jgi:DNA repair protein RadC
MRLKSRATGYKNTVDEKQKKSREISQEGHRARLRDKFLRSGLGALNDYEAVELLLTLGQPRKDCKQAAKDAIEHFKNLKGVLEASPEELQTIEGIGPVNSFGIKLVRELSGEYLKQKALHKQVLGSEKAALDFLYQSMGGLKIEVFRVLFLNTQNELIDSEEISSGTVNASPVFAREVMAAALRHHATGLIFAHNHPSGSITPSQDDKAVTRELVLVSGAMNLKVLDHFIVGDNTHFSFAAQGLIARYEAEAESLKRKAL